MNQNYVSGLPFVTLLLCITYENQTSVNGDILRRPSRTLHTTGYY